MLNRCGREKLGALLLIMAMPTGFLLAADIDWDELEKKAQQYTGKSTSISSGRSSSGSSAGSVNITLPEQPTARVVTRTERMLSEKDIRHITVHMKLANRNFKRKNYDKAIDELELVFERQPDHGGGRFMRAVIAARLRDYMTAWQNILVAKEKDPENNKITSFIDKLKTVMPEPEKFVGVPGVYRPSPISVCEKAGDVIERFLKEPISQNLISFSTEEFVSKGSGATTEMLMKFSVAPDVGQILDLFKRSTGEAVERTDDKSDPKQLKIRFELADLPLKNPKVKTVSSYRDFVKFISEETDVALSDSVERDKENKILEITNEVAARSFDSLNDFLRKASPYAHTYRVLELKLSYIKGQQEIIWKGKVRIEYQL
jgi:hypothetical protein